MIRLKNAVAAGAVVLALVPRPELPAAVSLAPAPLTGTVEGRVAVTRDGQRRPLRRATVTLSRESERQPRTTATDQDGRYRFTDVAAGNYRLSVTKAGFVVTTSRAGAAGVSSMAIAITADVTRSVDFEMQPAGALEGRFLDDRGRPLSRLAVSADRVTTAADGSVAVDYGAHSTITDDLGRFRLHTLPPGRYRVHAVPPPPASGNTLFYPGTENADDAGVLTVASGETVDRIDLTVATAPLSRIAAEALAAQERETTDAPALAGFTAQVSGHVVRSDTGLPIADAAVKLSTSAGALLRTAWTSADGAFVFGHLAAGEFVLAATADRYVGADASIQLPTGRGVPISLRDSQRTNVDVRLTPTSAIEGRIVDEFDEPAPGVIVAVTQRAQVAGAQRLLTGQGLLNTGATDDRGWFRAYGLFPGDYFLMAVPEPFAPSGPARFATTYFPGVMSFDAATAVHIAAGIDAFDANMSLLAVKTVTVSGLAVDTSGRPVPSATIVLLPTHAGEVRSEAMARTVTERDGRFVYRDIPEGPYVLQGMGSLMFGSAPVTLVTSPDGQQQDVVVTLKPLATASGRIVFDGGQLPAAAIALQFRPTDFTSGPVAPAPLVAEIAPDWSFRIRGLASRGTIVARVPPGWVFVRLQHRGRDITDTPYDFQSADVDGIEVVLTNRVGSVSGIVRNGDQPPTDARVLLFSADGPSTSAPRTVRAAVLKADGAFTMSDLLPGHYVVVALAATASVFDFQALRPVATPVFVTEGTKAEVRLSVIK